jgi:hypothetical protein
MRFDGRKDDVITALLVNDMRLMARKIFKAHITSILTHSFPITSDSTSLADFLTLLLCDNRPLPIGKSKKAFVSRNTSQVRTAPPISRFLKPRLISFVIPKK